MPHHTDHTDHADDSAAEREGNASQREHTETVPVGADHGEQRTQRSHDGTAGGDHDDVMTDPAHDDRIGTDWADEGGATPDGPATSVESGTPNHRAH